MKQLEAAAAVNGELLTCSGSSNQRCSARSAIPGWAHFPFGDVPTQVTDLPQRSFEGPAWILALRPPVQPSQRRSMRCCRPPGMPRPGAARSGDFRFPPRLPRFTLHTSSGWPTRGPLRLPRSTDHASLQRVTAARRRSSSHWWRSHCRRSTHFAAASLPAGLRVPAGAARPAERPPKRQGLGARRQVDPGRATGPQQFLQVQGRATQGPGPAQTAKRLHSG